MNKISRIIEFDIIKCLAIFLVLWGHSMLHLSVAGRNNDVFVIISMFNMPLFMLISGFFARKSLDLSFTTLVLKKGKQLIYPCISFGITFFLFSMIISLFKKHTFLSIQSFAEYLYGIFWFLKCLFTCYMILFCCIKFTNNYIWGGVVAICLSLFIPLFKVNWMMPFFVSGLILSQYFGMLLKYKITISIISIIVFVIFCALLFDEFQVWGDTISQTKRDLLNGNYSIIGKYLLVQIERFGVGISGSFMVLYSVFSISKIFTDNKITDWLNKFGRETLGIYIIQTLLLETIMANTMDLSNIDQNLFIYLITPILSMVVLYVCYLISTQISKSHVLKKLYYR